MSKKEFIIKNDNKNLKFKMRSRYDKWNQYHDFVGCYSKDAENLFQDYLIDVKKLLKSFTLDEIKDTLFLNLFSGNDKERFEELNIHHDFFNKFRYECAFNKYKHQSAIPVCLISRYDIENKYKSFFDKKTSIYVDMYKDKEYNLMMKLNNHLDYYKNKEGHKNIINELLNFFKYDSLSSVNETKQGSGYNDMCMPIDGGWSRDLFAVKLSNGDYLICNCMLWFNK